MQHPRRILSSGIVTLLAFSVLPGLYPSAFAASVTWDGGGNASGLWSDALNWSGDVAPIAGDGLLFGGTTNLVTSNDLPANTSFAGLTFNSDAGAFTLNGNAITLTGDVVNNSTATQTIAAGLGYSTVRNFNAAAGNLTLTGSLSGGVGSQFVKLGTGTVTISAPGANTIGSAGQGLIVKTGSLRINGGAGSVYTVTGEAWLGDTTNTNASMTLDSGTLNISTWFAVGRGNGTGAISSDLVLNNGAVLTSANFSSGFNAGNAANTPKSTITLNGTSSYTVSNNGTNFNFSESAGSNTVATLNGSSSLTHNGGTASVSRIALGANSKGVLNIASPTASANFYRVQLGGANGAVGAIYNKGTLNVVGAANVATLPIGNAVGAYGYLLIDNGAAANPVTTVTETGVGGSGGGNGVLDIRSGTFAVGTGGYLTIGRSTTVTQDSLVNVTGGTLQLSNIAGQSALHWSAVAHTGTSVLNVSGTGRVISNGATSDFDLMKANSGTTGLSALNIGTGGLVQVTRIATTAAGGTALLNFHGGTLKANAATTDLIGINTDGVYLYSEGGIIDTNGFNVTNGSPLLAPTGSGVSSITLGAPGTGYIGRPTVVLSGGDGIGATAVANFDETTGQVTGVTITNPGTGYTIAPTVTFGGGGGVSPSATAVLSVNTGGGLTKTGTGTLTLTSGGSNYTGPTVISNGTLAAPILSDGGQTSSIGASSNAAANLVFDGGTLQYTGFSTSTDRNFTIAAGKTAIIDVSNVATVLTMGGGAGATSGGLTKTGGGTLSPIGANLYTGPTVVAAGTLAATGTYSGGFTVNSGGHLTTQTFGVGSLTVPTLSLASGSAVDFEFGAGNDLINIANPGGLTLSSTALNLFQAGTAVPFTTNGTYTLFDYATNFVGNLNSGFTIGNSQLGKVYGLTNNTANTTIELTIADAVTTAWSAAGDGAWGATGNWTAGVPNSIGAIASFGSALTQANGTVTVGGPKTVGSLVFDNFNTYTISGGATDVITLNNGFGVPLITQVSGSHTIAAPLALTQSANVSAAFGTTLTVSGPVSGSGGFNLLDTGTVVLTGANTFTGPTVINAGTLEISGSGSLAGSSSITEKNGANFRIGGGTVVLPQPITFDLAGGTATGVNGGGGGLGNFGIEVLAGSNVTLNGLLTTTGGSFVKRGGGSLTLRNAGNNTLSNVGGLGTVVQEGALILDGGASATYSVVGGELTIGDNTPVEASVTLASGTLNVGTYTSIGRGNGTNALKSSLNVTGGVLNTTNLYTGYSNNVGGYNAMPVINISGTAVVNATGTAANTGVRFGESAGGISTINVSGGSTLTSTGDFQVGFGGTAVVNVSGNATINVPQLGLGFGNNAASNTGAGIIKQTGGTVQQAGAFGTDWRIGGYTGANDSQTYGYYSLAGGTLNSGGRNLQIGANGYGILDVSGGVYTSVSNFPVVGRFASGFGLLNISAGSVNQNAAGNLFIIGEAGNGVVNVSGTGALNVAGAPGAAGAGGGTGGIRLGHTATGIGELNINGGTVTTTGIAKSIAAGIASVYLNGGVLRAGAANTTFLQGLDNTVVGPGGAILDTNGNDITVAQPLTAPVGQGVLSIPIVSGGSGYLGAPYVQITGGGTGATAVANMTGDVVTSITITNPGTGYTSAPFVSLVGGGTTNPAFVDTFAITTGANAVDGGLKKRGAGVLTLAGANTYTGPTVVEAGTLALTGSISGSSSVLVKSGAVFDVNNVVGGFTLGNGQTLKGGGTVFGSVTMQAGSKLDPGETLGTLAMGIFLDITGGATAAATHSLLFDLGATSASDRVTLTSGTLSIGTGVLAFDDFQFTNVGGLQAGVYTLFDTNASILGTLDTNLANLKGAIGAFTGTLGIGDNGNDIILTVIPEPGSAATLAAGVGLLLTSRFRRRSRSGQ